MSRLSRPGGFGIWKYILLSESQKRRTYIDCKIPTETLKWLHQGMLLEVFLEASESMEWEYIYENTFAQEMGTKCLVTNTTCPGENDLRPCIHYLHTCKHLFKRIALSHNNQRCIHLNNQNNHLSQRLEIQPMISTSPTSETSETSSIQLSTARSECQKAVGRCLEPFILPYVLASKLPLLP